MNTIWMHKDEYDALKKLKDDFWSAFLWRNPPIERTEEQKYRLHLKLAYVVIDGKRQMMYVHNENMKAYRFKDYYELITPLVEVQYDSFERWCTSFDT